MNKRYSSDECPILKRVKNRNYFYLHMSEIFKGVILKLRSNEDSNWDVKGFPHLFTFLGSFVGRPNWWPKVSSRNVILDPSRIIVSSRALQFQNLLWHQATRANLSVKKIFVFLGFSRSGFFTRMLPGIKNDPTVVKWPILQWAKCLGLWKIWKSVACLCLEWGGKIWRGQLLIGNQNKNWRVRSV